MTLESRDTGPQVVRSCRKKSICRCICRQIVVWFAPFDCQKKKKMRQLTAERIDTVQVAGSSRHQIAVG